MSETGWYYAHNGQSVGPVDLWQLRTVLSSGTVPADAMVWREGFEQWLPAPQVPELATGPAPAAAVATEPAPAPAPSHPYVVGYAQPQTGFAYAGFWKRFAAFIIDWLVLLIPNFIIGFLLDLFLALGGAINDTTPDSAFDLVGNLIGLFTGWLYYGLMESSRYQGTLGKLALGIKVTDMNGQPISFGRASGRHFAKILSGIILLIGYIMVAFTKEKQGLHDMLAKCLVINRA